MRRNPGSEVAAAGPRVANPATAGIPVVLVTGADAAGLDDGGKPPDVGAMLTKNSLGGLA